MFVEASVVEDDDTPKRQFLKRGISILAHDTNLKSKKIVSLKCIISNLRDHNLINEDTSTLLLDNFGEN